MKCRQLLTGLVILLTVVLLGLSGQASAVQVYFNDFSTSVGPELSATSGPLLIATAPSSEQFLGTDAQYGLTNNTVTLSLAALPSHTNLSLSFDLYIIHSWDGNSSVSGPDHWKYDIQGQTVLDTTFSNISPSLGLGPSYNQSYPSNYPGSFPAQTGATNVGGLGYDNYLGQYGTDATDHLTYSLPHTASTVTINFQAWNLQTIDDESWGLDNVKVEVSGVPVPPTALLLGSGLVGLLVLRRWKA
jgi:hypothetical protein